MFNNSVNITTGARATNSSIYYNVGDFFIHNRYNYRMNIAKRLPMYCVYALLAYMPFHIFLSQWLSLATGGLEIWKVAKDLVLLLITVFSIISVWILQKQNKLFNTLVALTSLYAIIHLLVWWVNKDIYSETAILGTTYNVRVFGYLLLGYSAVLLWPEKIDYSKVIKIVLWVSSIVSLLAILQYLLPRDLMSHFGYSLERGVRPTFFIDDKPDLPRVMSTIRDPNSLGAYLLLPILFLIDGYRKNKQKMFYAGLILLHFLALFLTFSRAALVGLGISVIAYFVLSYGKNFSFQRFKKPILITASVLVLLSIFGFVLRDQYVVQNIILHSDETTTAELDSNDLHLEFTKTSAQKIVDKPIGHGPGTAGIVSIRNPDGGLLTENYYLQIASETGIVGLLLYLIMCVIVLFSLPSGNIMARCLFSAFVAYSIMALIMHLWSNEAVSAQWWLLTGFVLGGVASKAYKGILGGLPLYKKLSM